MIHFRKQLKSESGQSSVLLALVFVVLCIVAAFSVDIGRLSAAKSELQNAADAAALSGAQELPLASVAKDSAVSYAVLNGVEESALTINTPYAGDPKKIEVICTKTVDYTFARVLGMTSTDISARAVAEVASMSGGPFSYTVFSGSASDTLTFNGSMYIGGSAHSNYQFRINGSSLSITEAAEAVSNFTANGSSITIDTCKAASITLHGSSINIENTLYTAAPFIEMPDFSSEILANAEAFGEVYTGDTTFNGSNINVDSPIYVDGNVQVNGSSFSGQGVIIATGNITFNGSNLTNTSDDAVCFYSINGDITVNGSNAELDGIVYAPNGAIRMNGSGQTINGRVIGETVNFNGSDIWIVAEAGDLDCLPEHSVKLVE